jgi:predicted RNA-binding protein Jag
MVHNLLNVDVVSEQQDCLFRINGQHRALMVGKDGLAVDAFQPADVGQTLDGLHFDNKRVLMQLLEQRVRDQIGLILWEPA